LTFKENLRLCGFHTYTDYRFLVLYLISVQLTFEKDEEVDQRGGKRGKGIIRRRNRKIHGVMDIRGTNIITRKTTERF